jgi:streptogramin lyase/mono/diheme cytochrome c family protein
MLKGHLKLGICAAALLLLGCSESSDVKATSGEGGTQTAALDAKPGPDGWAGAVRGTVTDLNGGPVEGAYVKLRNEARHLTVMVISKDEGAFIAGNLPSGQWTVQAVGGDVESQWTKPVNVSTMGTVETNVAMTELRKPDLAAAWPRRMPEELASVDSLPNGHGKDIIQKSCTSCHDAARIAANRDDREGWTNTIDGMRVNMKNAGLPPMSDEDAAALLDYVSENMPPMGEPDPNSRLPRELVEGEARNYRVVEYDLENLGAEPHDVAVDPAGIGWANQRFGGKVSRFDPVTYEYSEVSPPMTYAPKARLGNLQISADGMMWLPDPNERRWLSYDTKSGEWTTWPFPETIRGQPNGNSLAIAADGAIWASGPGSARRLDPKTKEWQSWDTPTWTKTKKNPGGYGLTIDGDGRAWMAMNLVDKMARFDHKTGEVLEFKVPVEGTSYPRRMGADANGDVWVGLWGSGQVLHIDHKTTKMEVLDPPTPKNGAYMVSADLKKNQLWVTLHTVDKIARYDPQTKVWTEFALPYAEHDTRRIQFDPNHPNRIWFSGVAHHPRIGYIEMLP